MQHIIEDPLILIPHRTLANVIPPTFKERRVANLLLIPRCGIFGQKFEHTKRQHTRCIERGGVYNQLFHIGHILGERIGFIIKSWLEVGLGYRVGTDKHIVLRQRIGGMRGIIVHT